MPRRRAARGLAHVAVFALPGAPVTGFAAVYYEMTTSSESPGPGGDQEMQMNTYVDGENGRIEFVSTQGNPLFTEGGYMLTHDAGSTIYLVNPAEKTYMQLDLDAILGMAGNMMNAMGGVMEMSFDNVVSENLGQEPGDELLGYPTTRYSFRTAYDMNIKVMGFNRSSHSESTTQVWCTDEVGSSGFNIWLRPDRMRTGNEGLDELISQQLQLPECLPLRIVSISATDGQRGEMRSETVVTTLRQESNFDPEMFALPADYTETTLMDQLPEGVELPQGFPFGNSAQGTDNGSAETEDEPEEESRGGFRRFRDLVGR